MKCKFSIFLVIKLVFSFFLRRLEIYKQLVQLRIGFGCFPKIK
jgi:hypothetical protein